MIGAGVSGLIAALVLEGAGFYPTLIEATDRAGGRVKTDTIDDFLLDRGFQVMLSNYPAAQKYLDFHKLSLQKFKPGAAIFMNGKQKVVSDPTRDPFALFSTLLSGIGQFSDYFKILKLVITLKKKSLCEIFDSPEQTTKEYLLTLGFSSQIIDAFFSPFFTGIFLETDLETSSRMFEFVFKMFSEGSAVIPKGGIEEISKQLHSKLKHTDFRFNTEVTSVENKKIMLSSGEFLRSDATIIATDSKKLIKTNKANPHSWKSCQTLYFKTKKRVISKPYIGLIPSKNCLINNIFYPTCLNKNHLKEELLCVTVVKKHHFSKTALVAVVTEELKKECNIQGVQFLKQYDLAKALPRLTNLQYVVSPLETQITDTLFLAGDLQLNGSLNGAMLAGEKAAVGVLENFKKLGIIG